MPSRATNQQAGETAHLPNFQLFLDFSCWSVWTTLLLLLRCNPQGRETTRTLPEIFSQALPSTRSSSNDYPPTMVCFPPIFGPTIDYSPSDQWLTVFIVRELRLSACFFSPSFSTFSFFRRLRTTIIRITT